MHTDSEELLCKCTYVACVNVEQTVHSRPVKKDIEVAKY